MTIIQADDQRNQEWRTNNVGSSLLQKMGWKEGSGIGKRSSNTTALRAVKRQDGLGLGAKMASEGGQSESTNTFAAVLANLHKHHGGGSSNGSDDDDCDGERRKKSSKGKKSSKRKREKDSDTASEISSKSGRIILPQNKVTAGHAQKMRMAKFGEKSAEDLACIFGNTNVAVALTSTATPLATPTVSQVVEKTKKTKKRPREGKEKDDDEMTPTTTTTSAVNSQSGSAKEVDDAEEMKQKKKQKKEEKKKSKKKKSSTSS